MRTDIQALRGLAVVFVIGYHLWPRRVAAGFLGVDIFFVISGYLITKMVSAEMVAGRFTFADFYSRRIRRLLPAAYTTFAVTTVCAVVILSQQELRDFFWQLVGAVTFSANVALWRQTGYFSGDADIKPLLHVWSLSIEEQFYLLWPAALVFTPRKYWAPGSILVCGASLALWILRAPAHPLATFYLLPTRAWEIALGAVGALALVPDRLSRLLQILYWPALAALIVIPAGFIEAEAQGLLTIAACAATLMVILRDHPTLGQALPIRVLALVGNFSYSLYLVHWPILALFRNVWFGPVPLTLELSYLVLIFAFGILQYRFIELPFRRSPFRLTWRSAAAVAAGSLAMVAIPFMALLFTPSPSGPLVRLHLNHGLAPSCGSQGLFTLGPECRTNARPSVLIWGDSFATHLVPGLVATSGDTGLAQATRSACAPLLGVAPVSRQAGPQMNRLWAEDCIAFNHSVVTYLRGAKEIEVVVLSSAWHDYVEPDRAWLLQNHSLHAPGSALALAALKRTVDAVRALGKRVVLVAPPPSSFSSSARCHQRRLNGQFRLGPVANCEISLEGDLERNGDVRGLIRRVPAEAGVDVVHLKPFLCPNGSCLTLLDGAILYRDSAHLSYDGSQVIARRMHLFDLIRAAAR